MDPLHRRRKGEVGAAIGAPTQNNTDSKYLSDIELRMKASITAWEPVVGRSTLATPLLLNKG